MGPYRHEDTRPLPTREELREWLRNRITKPPPGRWARWLGEPTSYRYEIDEPVPWENDFLGMHRLFTVRSDEPGLLPLPRWERRRQESWGIFAMGRDGFEMLSRSTGSLTRLLRAEERSLDQGSLHFLAELVCALELGEGPEEVHTLVPQEPTLHGRRESKAGWYAIDGEKVMWLGGDVVLPTIEPLLAGGWQIRFSTLIRSHGRPLELGTELLIVSPDFSFRRYSREVVASSHIAFAIVNPGRIDEPGSSE